MEAIEMCLENSGPLDVEALKATVVDSIDAEMNPCFESPLLLDIACRLGNLDLVQQLLTMHLPQDRQERSRHLVGDCQPNGGPRRIVSQILILDSTHLHSPFRDSSEANTFRHQRPSPTSSPSTVASCAVSTQTTATPAPSTTRARTTASSAIAMRATTMAASLRKSVLVRMGRCRGSLC